MHPSFLTWKSLRSRCSHTFKTATRHVAAMHARDYTYIDAHRIKTTRVHSISTRSPNFCERFFAPGAVFSAARDLRSYTPDPHSLTQRTPPRRLVLVSPLPCLFNLAPHIVPRRTLHADSFSGARRSVGKQCHLRSAQTREAAIPYHSIA
jgi:hypothetical protein